ncbi:glycosyltransferase family 39 protein [bacterium]|nr:glycosyltransferase family 39 protein [bacterium]
MISKKQIIIVLVLILLGGACVRLWNINDKGLFFWDEGLFLMGSKFVSWRMTELCENVQRFGWKLSSLNSDVQHYQGYPVFLQKPGHVFLLTVASLFLGVDDRLGQAVSALFGVLSLVMVYLIGCMSGGRRVGLIAALFCAFSPSHVHYSRVGLHEISSTFFVLGSVFLHLQALRPQQARGHDEVLLFFTGLGLSCAVICSYRWIILIPLFVLMDTLTVTLRSKKFMTVLWRNVLMFTGFLIPLSFAELSYFICFYPDYLQFQPSSYFWVLLYKFSSETHLDLTHPFHYVFQLGRFEGFFFLILVSFGLVWAGSSRERTRLYLCSLIMVPFLLYSFNTTRVARAISVILPFLSIMAALAIVSLQNRIKDFQRLWRLSTVLLILIPLSQFCVQNLKVLSMKSGYRQAFAYIRQHSNGKHFSTMSPIGSLQFGRDAVPLHPPATLDEMRELCLSQGYRYVLIDWQKYVWYGSSVSDYYASIHEIETRYEPVMIIANTYVEEMSVLNENYIPGLLEAILEDDPTINTIRIYDLNAVFNIPVQIETIMVRTRKDGPAQKLSV